VTGQSSLTSSCAAWRERLKGRAWIEHPEREQPSRVVHTRGRKPTSRVAAASNVSVNTGIFPYRNVDDDPVKASGLHPARAANCFRQHPPAVAELKQVLLGYLAPVLDDPTASGQAG
jgi:hypothetical protein